MVENLSTGANIDGRYEVQRVLGQGAFATTYLATDAKSDKEVAIKAISMTKLNDWKAFELFEREVAVLKGFKHPNIPQFLDYVHSDDEDSHYLVQEYAKGQSLKEKLNSDLTPSNADIANIGKQLLKVLVYLGNLNPPVVHRDIKPANIIVDEQLNVKLVDFGAAKDKMSSHTALGSTVVGTFGYMAPEQFQGRACPQSDIYAVGATLIHLLTGVVPSDLPHTRMKIDFSSYVNAEHTLAPLLEKMVEPAIEDRFESPALLLEYMNNPQAWAEAQKPRFPVLPAEHTGALSKPVGARLQVQVESDGTFVLSTAKKVSFNDRRRLLVAVMGVGMALLWSGFMVRLPLGFGGALVSALLVGGTSFRLWSLAKQVMSNRRIRIGPKTFVISRLLNNKETVIHSGETAQLNGVDYFLHEPGFFENRRQRRFDLGIKEGLNQHVLLEGADVLEAQWAAQELEEATGIKSQTESFAKPTIGNQLGRMAELLVSNLADKVNKKWFK